ncbi:hypothetical protein TNCV_1896941 [Trichonephila clavipes]|nr:hypothetical protein TNCV_1896941 [Trichonephila clavipes]
MIARAGHLIQRSWFRIPPGSCGSPVVKVCDRGRHVMSSSPVPLKTRRVGQQCTLNLSRAETSSRWCGVVAFSFGRPDCKNSSQSHIMIVYDAGNDKSGVFHSAEWHDGDWSNDGIREAWLWCFIWVESFLSFLAWLRA